MTLKFNLKNKLWEDDPHMARAMFEAELRDMIPKNPDSVYQWVLLIKEILGE